MSPAVNLGHCHRCGNTSSSLSLLELGQLQPCPEQEGSLQEGGLSLATRQAPAQAITVTVHLVSQGPHETRLSHHGSQGETSGEPARAAEARGPLCSDHYGPCCSKHAPPPCPRGCCSPSRLSSFPAPSAWTYLGPSDPDKTDHPPGTTTSLNLASPRQGHVFLSLTRSLETGEPRV